MLLRLLVAVCVMSETLLLPGCKQSEPEPSVPGYYTGPIKRKSEVAPGPGGGPAAGEKAGTATEGSR